MLCVRQKLSCRRQSDGFFVKISFTLIAGLWTFWTLVNLVTRHGSCKFYLKDQPGKYFFLWKVTPRYDVKRLKPASLTLNLDKITFFFAKDWPLLAIESTKMIVEILWDEIFFINDGVELEELVHFSFLIFPGFSLFLNFYLNLCAAWKKLLCKVAY
jgi:hypothetical protein